MSVPTKVYWDACCFIALIQQESARYPALRSIYTAAEKGEIVIVTSTLTIAEVCRVRCDEGAGKPRCVMPVDGDKYLSDFFDNDFFWLVELSPSLAVRARELYRAHPTVRIPNDSVHLATALSENVDELHTYDGNDLIELTGQTLRADGEPLKICVPEALSLDLFSNEPIDD